jgi:hypothetical protein
MTAPEPITGYMDITLDDEQIIDLAYALGVDIQSIMNTKENSNGN